MIGKHLGCGPDPMAPIPEIRSPEDTWKPGPAGTDRPGLHSLWCPVQWAGNSWWCAQGRRQMGF